MIIGDVHKFIGHCLIPLDNCINLRKGEKVEELK